MPTLRTLANNNGAATWSNDTPTTQATAITAATVMTLNDSGGVFTVSQAAAYDIDLPTPTGPGIRYLFQLVAPGAFNVTITPVAAGPTFEGTIYNAATSVLPCTGNTLTFAANNARLGDTIEVISTSTTRWSVRTCASNNGGITIA